MSDVDNDGKLEVVIDIGDEEIVVQTETVEKYSNLEKMIKQLDSRMEKIAEFMKHKKDTQLNLKAGGVNLALNVRDSDQFPPFPERIENLMQTDSAFMLDMLIIQNRNW